MAPNGGFMKRQTKLLWLLLLLITPTFADAKYNQAPEFSCPFATSNELNLVHHYCKLQRNTLLQKSLFNSSSVMNLNTLYPTTQLIPNTALAMTLPISVNYLDGGNENETENDSMTEIIIEDAFNETIDPIEITVNNEENSNEWNNSVEDMIGNEIAAITNDILNIPTNELQPNDSNNPPTTVVDTTINDGDDSVNDHNTNNKFKNKINLHAQGNPFNDEGVFTNPSLNKNKSKTNEIIIRPEMSQGFNIKNKMIIIEPNLTINTVPTGTAINAKLPHKTPNTPNANIVLENKLPLGNENIPANNLFNPHTSNGNPAMNTMNNHGQQMNHGNNAGRGRP